MNTSYKDSLHRSITYLENRKKEIGPLNWTDIEETLLTSANESFCREIELHGGKTIEWEEPTTGTDQKSKWERLFKHPQHGDALSLTLRCQGDGCWVVMCEELPGLLLWHKDLQKLLSKIPIVTSQMLRLITEPQEKP